MSTDSPEIARLRAEVEQLRTDLRLTERECEILHSLQNARSDGGTAVVRSIQIGSRERMAMLEHAIDVLDGFVHEMASYDCYGCEPDSKCNPCRAQEALDAVKNWRFDGAAGSPARCIEGAMHYRVSNGWNPRETKIYAEWVKYMNMWGPDRMLGAILTDRKPGQSDGVRDWPTPRDWYVATSVVQWLATNCGSTILEDAGWKYTQWDEDTAALDVKRKISREASKEDA